MFVLSYQSVFQNSTDYNELVHTDADDDADDEVVAQTFESSTRSSTRPAELESCDEMLLAAALATKLLHGG